MLIRFVFRCILFVDVMFCSAYAAEMSGIVTKVSDGDTIWVETNGGKWRYVPSSTPKATTSPPTSVNSPAANRVALGVSIFDNLWAFNRNDMV